LLIRSLHVLLIICLASRFPRFPFHF
jgi:hypothetical protein